MGERITAERALAGYYDAGPLIERLRIIRDFSRDAPKFDQKSYKRVARAVAQSHIGRISPMKRRYWEKTYEKMLENTKFREYAEKMEEHYRKKATADIHGTDRKKGKS